MTISNLLQMPPPNSVVWTILGVCLMTVKTVYGYIAY